MKAIFLSLILLGGVGAAVSQNTLQFDGGAVLAMIGLGLLAFASVRDAEATRDALAEKDVDDFPSLAMHYSEKVAERRALAAERLALGIHHAKVNHEVVAFEEELIARFPNHDITFNNGLRVIVGNHTSRLRDRVRVEGETNL